MGFRRWNPRTSPLPKDGSFQLLSRYFAATFSCSKYFLQNLESVFLMGLVMKVDGGETKEDESDVNDAKEKDPAGEVGAASSVENSNQMAVNSPSNGGFRRDGNARSRRMVGSGLCFVFWDSVGLLS